MKITSHVSKRSKLQILRNNGELLPLMAEMLGNLSAVDCMGVYAYINGTTGKKSVHRPCKAKHIQYIYIYI